jgi:hypothetical protein
MSVLSKYGLVYNVAMDHRQSGVVRALTIRGPGIVSFHILSWISTGNFGKRVKAMRSGTEEGVAKASASAMLEGIDSML